MFDKQSQKIYEKHTPKSRKGLVKTWIVAALTTAFMIYLFVADFVDSSLDPLIAGTIFVVGIVAGYLGTTRELQNERFRRLGSNVILRFSVFLIGGAIGVVVALWFTQLFGYLAIGIIGVLLTSAVARTILYIRGA